ncbi:hypothetical protein D3C72_1270480 [compost metagenome]
MQYLALVGNGDTLLPLGGAVIAGGLDLQNAGTIRVTHHLTVEVGEHEGVLGMLEYRIDPAHLVAGAFGVDLCQYRLQLDTPQHCLFQGDILRCLARGFLQPQRQWAFVGGEADRHGGIGRADPQLADIQPLLAGQFSCRGQSPGLAIFGFCFHRGSLLTA